MSRQTINSKTNHPFYCFKKNTRKTAWDTPEYLSDADWLIIKELVKTIKSKDINKLHKLLYNNQMIFNRVLGWPEGLTYCMSYDYVKKTAFDMFIKNDLKKLEKALADRKKSLTFP